MNQMLDVGQAAGDSLRFWRKPNGKSRIVSLATLLSLFVPLYFSTLSAQATTTTSNRVDVALQATVVESLSIVVANPAVAFGIVTPGTRNTPALGQTIAITSAWTLGVGETVKLYAYFDSASSAMTGTLLGDIIPTAAFTGSFNGGAYQSFTQSSPFTAGSTALNLYSVGITTANSLLTARQDSLALAMNLTGISLHPDTYVGVMHIQAQAL